MQRRLLRILTPALLVTTVAYFWAFKRGSAQIVPELFAILIGLVCLGLLAGLGLVLDFRRTVGVLLQERVQKQSLLAG